METLENKSERFRYGDYFKSPPEIFKELWDFKKEALPGLVVGGLLTGAVIFGAEYMTNNYPETMETVLKYISSLAIR